MRLLRHRGWFGMKEMKIICFDMKPCNIAHAATRLDVEKLQMNDILHFCLDVKTFGSCDIALWHFIKFTSRQKWLLWSKEIHVLLSGMFVFIIGQLRSFTSSLMGNKSTSETISWGCEGSFQSYWSCVMTHSFFVIQTIFPIFPIDLNHLDKNIFVSLVVSNWYRYLLKK